LQNAIITKFCYVFHADFLKVCTNRLAFMARRDDDLAVLLAQYIKQHLAKRVLFNRLLLRFIEYEQSRMIASGLRAHFEKPDKICPVQPNQVASGYVSLEIQIFRLGLVCVERNFYLSNGKTAHLVSRELLLERVLPSRNLLLISFR
jgi:hypothetical protein